MPGVPSSFKAAVMPSPRSRHTIAERSLAPLAAGEVAIKVTATAINPVDWKIRDQGILLGDDSSKFPAVLGSDAAGEIVAVGAGVIAGFAIGDRVFFQGILARYDACTFQQYCKMPAELVSHTPANITDEQAAGVQLALMAVVTGFYHMMGRALAPGPWEEGGRDRGRGKAIVILGGSSSVGQYAVQMARLSGFERIVTNSSAAHIEHLKALGATVVLDRRTQTTPEDFRDAIGHLPLEFVWDSIAEKETGTLGIDILRLAKGTTTGERQLVCVWNPNDLPNPFSGAHPGIVAAGQAAEPKVAVKQILGLGSGPGHRYVSEPVVKAMSGEEGWIGKGLFEANRPLVVHGGLSMLDKALDMNKQGVSGQKLVIKPFESL